MARPQVPGAYGNLRLFGRLDEDLAAGRMVWIGAPAGSGKTTLAASYAERRDGLCLWLQVQRGDRDPAFFFDRLDAAAGPLRRRGSRRAGSHLGSELASDVTAFASHWFAAFYDSLPAGTLVVIDDAHLLESVAWKEALLTAATSVEPRGHTQLVFLGRLPPPACLARLQSQRGLAAYGWPEMRLSDTEARDLLRHVGALATASAQIDRLVELADGWAAGLVLLAGTTGEHEPAGHRMDDAPQVLIDYFTSELWQQLDDEARDLLMAVAIFPTVSVPVAAEWSGNDRAERILEQLRRQQLFVLRQSGRPPSYQVHPLFREFLRHRMRTESAADVDARRCRRAAELLEKHGLAEAALELFEESGDLAAVASFARRHGAALTRAGKIETLGRCLDLLPEDMVAEDPWLGYWTGVRLLSSDTVVARQHLERAYDRFFSARERRGLYLAWARIIESLIYESGGYAQLDRWLDAYAELRSRFRQPTDPEVFVRVNLSLLNAVLFRRSDSPALRRAERKLRWALLVASDVNVRFMIGASLIRYYQWAGDMPAARALLNRLRGDSSAPGLGPFAQVVWAALASACGWLMEPAEAGLQAMREGLALAGRTGIHLFDFYFLVQGTYSALSLDQLDAAAELIERMAGTFKPERTVDMGQCVFLRGWLELARGQAAEGLASMQQAIETARATGSPYVIARAYHGLSQAQAQSQRYEEALASLGAASAIAGPHGFRPIEYLADLCRAEIAFAQGRTETARRWLASSLLAGQQHGYEYIPHWTRRQLAALCARALEAGIARDYARDLIRRHGLTLPEGLAALAVHWPWPVRVATLGGFGVWIDGRPLRFARKEQSRPLDLLKVLIAMGGSRVRIGRVADALWPEADADAARDALKTTLARLRKLIGHDTVEQSEGCLSLRGDQIWVDALAAESAFDAFLESRSLTTGRDGLALYRGAFLGSEPEAAWALAPRERLRGKFGRVVERIGGALLDDGDLAGAQECFARALDADDSHEAFYLGLMRCHATLGRSGDALRVYERYHRIVVEDQGRPVAAGIDELRRRIQAAAS